MLSRIGSIFDEWARKYIPDPMVFAVILTFLTFALGLIFTPHGPMQLIIDWNKGFWELLTFSMQMCLILVTGHALATTPLIRKSLTTLAALPRTQGAAIIATALVGGFFSLINWGLGIIVGALFAREIGVSAHKRKLAVHYPLVGAAAYAGFILWHGGLSGSAPLLVATGGHFLENEIGIIPTSQTLFSPLNITVCLLLLVVVPITLYLLAPIDPTKIVSIETVLPEAVNESQKAPAENKKTATIAQKLENSRILSVLLGLTGMVYVVYHFIQKGFALDLNIVNFTFLFAGIILQGGLKNYVAAVTDGAKACAGIIIQFPLYAGLMGIMKYSGLVGVMASGFVAISNETTYPVLTFLSAGIINIFVPSGGGQWAVQGPIIVEAAKELSVSMPKIVMAVAYGDEWTNMLQPFWALALLGITGLKAREIVGYTMVVLITAGVVFVASLLVFQ